MRNAFPQFDKYWERESEGPQKIKGKDIKVHLAYSLSSKQEREYGIVNNGSGPVPAHDFEMLDGNPLPPKAPAKAIEMVDMNEEAA